MSNWKVEWQSPMRTEVRYFEDRLAAQRYAEHMERQTYRTRPVVSYVGAANHMTATFAIGAL